MKKADITISAVRVRPEEAAGRLGVLEEDQDHRVVGFHEKPPQSETIAGAPEHVLGSMGVYVFRAGVLREVLQEPEDDFGRGAIPKAISAKAVTFSSTTMKKRTRLRISWLK